MDNRTTLSSYDNNIDEYISNTPHKVDGDIEEWILETLKRLPTNSKILEIGSGFSRDADYIESLGYSVERTDASKGFVDYMRSKGKDAGLLDVLKDSISGSYDLIFADAVFLHFTKGEIKTVFSKCNNSLNQNGILSFSLKEGSGEEWSTEKLSNPRFFRYWEKDELARELSLYGFTIISAELKEAPQDSPKWLHIIAQKTF